MYRNNEYNPSVNILLEPGIYIFDNESATGKTRLCKCLKKLKAYGEPVDSFTYNDKLSGYSLENVLKHDNKVVMLDRYDMYSAEGWDLINNFASNGIILIDCKSPFLGSTDIQDCYIDMTESSIEVSI